MRDTRLFSTLSMIGFLVTAVLVVAMIWQTNRAAQLREKAVLAETVLAEYLHLKANVYQLFKQYGDALIIGDLDKGAGEKALSNEIETNFKTIRALIGKEIELIGESEIEELVGLNELEKRIDALVEEFENIIRYDRNPTRAPHQWRALSQILDVDIDRDFIAMIRAAVEEEREEVVAARAAMVAHEKLVRQGSGFLAVLAFLAVGASLYTYQIRFSKPVGHLLEGAKVFSDGDFSHRIDVGSKGDVAVVSHVLNEMAEHVEMRQDQLERKNLELEERVAGRTSELEHLLARSEASEANRSRLLADVSHELRTPLTIIQGESEIALRGGSKNEREYKEALTQALEAARHCGQLVDDLLLVSRQEAGALRLDTKNVDLIDVLEDAMTIFGDQIVREFEFDEAPVVADAVRIRQSVLALFQNSRRYGATFIQLGLSETSSGYRISVTDDGIGMSDEEKARAFERFFRGSNAAAHYSQGTGLGLPVVKSIIEAHGGRVVLSDRTGGGLVVTCEIPRDVQSKQATSAVVVRLRN